VGNTVTDNKGAGISHEISGDATIADNVVRRNGYRSSNINEAGILVVNSHDVDIRGNTVEMNARQVELRQDARTDKGVLKSIHLSGNVLGIDRAGNVAVNRSSDINIPGWGQDVMFFDNRYELRIADRVKPFIWRGIAMTVNEWKRAGNDIDSEFIRLE
jgi:parallel beta-helix repeat protein